jgi:hypothetical protein
VWWTLFTAVDLYIGLIVLDSLAPTLPPEKQRRLASVRKIILALLALAAIVLILQIVKRH